MRFAAVVLGVLLLPGMARAADKTGFNWSASLSASTSTTLNSEIIQKPQYGFSLSGHKGTIALGADIRTARSSIGTDSEDKFYARAEQKLKPFDLHYEVTYRVYPGTLPGYHDSGLTYSVSASRSFLGVSCSLGADYTGEDYSTTRKAVGYSVSLGRGLAPKLSGWISVAHKRQWGSVDYTNTNIGVYYQATSKIGVSTSVNTWHAFAPWGRDHPSLSVSLSRRL